MQCTKCGFANPEGMKFCGQCATPLAPLCPHCQFENPPGFKFCGDCGKPLAAQSSTALGNDKKPAVADALASHPQAERRQLTVLFCDVVGSAALSEHVDPEDLRDIMGKYRDTCQEVVGRFQGHIAQYLGDGILVYFGYPQANEDDAIRAVQAGLELIEHIRGLNEQLSREQGISLSIRVGVHTGLVVIGEIGSDDKRSLAMGTTPNVAARLQDLAEADSVVISNATYRLTQARFVCVALGEHQLKGFSHPFTLYKVNSMAQSARTGAAQAAFNQVPLIGREQESALIVDRFEQAKTGQGQVVLLSGEAGIGKSRLVQLLREVADDGNNCLFECWGSPYHKNSFLHCVVNVLHSVLELEKCATDDEKIKQLEAPLTAFGVPLSENVPLLAELLSIPLPKDRYPALQVTPQQRKQKILEALLSVVLGLAAQRMVVIIIEDLHWIDPTTIELLGLLLDQVPTANIFVLLSYRLEFTPPWAPRSHITHISTNRLTRKQSGHMVRWIAKNKDLPISVFNEIISKTDGTPFFVEELTKMVLESALLKETHERYELAGPIANLAIPSTLQDSLMARLDKLGSAKELAQLSATLGREFAHSLLSAVTGSSYENLDQHLAHLVFHELLYQRGLPPMASYTFRHALVHEVAYQSLLKKTRQKYHRKIAEVLAAQFPEKIQENPELMAHHCNEAGDCESAMQYWMRAGRMAIQRSANADATVHLNNALQALKNLPESPQLAEIELQIQASRGLAYMLLNGYAADEVQCAYGRAYELSRYSGKSSAMFPILCGLWEFYLVRAELDAAQDLAVQLQTIAAETSKPDQLLEAQRALGATSFWRGDFSSAEQHLARAIKSDAADQASERMPVYGHDTQAAALGSAACVSWLMGYADRAVELINQSAARTKKINHPFSIVYASYFSAVIHQLRGNAEKTGELAETTMRLCEKYEFWFWYDTAAMVKIWAQHELTGDNKLISQYTSVLHQYVKRGSRLALTYMHSLLARMHIKAGQWEQAETVIDKAISKLNTHYEHFFQAELYRLKAVITWQRKTTATNDIEACFNQALHTARRQSALGLELRVMADYCRYLYEQRQTESADQMLTDILQRVNEGQTTRDYQQVELLLQQIKNAPSIKVQVETL
ncbi:MAG TPA: adenylate/guanylate cyclase domain-containing protein [Gammaproteobacteria bacterium]